MEPSAATSEKEAPSKEAATKEAPAREPLPKDRHLPPMVRIGDIIAPRAPQDVAGARLEEGILTELAVRLVYTINRFTIEWVSKRLHISIALAGEVIEQLCREGVVEETMMSSQASKAQYRITQRGREHAIRAMDVCAYLGPAPVSLEAYSAMLRWQFASTPQVKPEHVTAALSSLVLTQKAIQLAGLAVSSGRSLFVFGPSGNGKSSLGRQIHAALSGDYWIPYCISVRNNIIRLFDEQVHQRVDVPDKTGSIDQRWVRIRRPLVVVGGELTLEFLDLIYSPSLRYYEAPPHLKANGGVFLVDDFGRERVSPHQLLNRFITPMEHHIDYFTLSTGQKIQVPLRHVLIIATNLDPETVTDPAFLRRMGYRLCLEAPNPEAYSRIFKAYAERHGAAVAPEVLDSLLERYRLQKRELRACEPRDLIERARDICRFQGKPLELTPKVLDLAWVGYFGSELPGTGESEEGGKAPPS
jgi:predicted ATPase with chaperone activity